MPGISPKSEAAATGSPGVLEAALLLLRAAEPTRLHPERLQQLPWKKDRSMPGVRQWWDSRWHPECPLGQQDRKDTEEQGGKETLPQLWVSCSSSLPLGPVCGCTELKANYSSSAK